MSRSADVQLPTIDSLSELKKIDASTEPDVTKRKLAELFSVEEINVTDHFVDADFVKEQTENTKRVNGIFEWVKNKIHENEEKKSIIDEKLYAINTVRSNFDQTTELSGSFSSLVENLATLPEYADILMLIDDLTRKNQNIEELLPKIIYYLESYKIPYEQHELELFLLPFSTKQSASVILERISLKLFRNKEKKIFQNAKTSIESLRIRMETRIIQEAEKLSKQFFDEIESLKHNKDLETLEENVKMLSLLSRNVRKIYDGYSRICIPDEFFNLREDIDHYIAAGITRLISYQEAESNRLGDTSSIRSSALHHLHSVLDRSTVISPTLRSATYDLLDYLHRETEAAQNGNDELIVEIETLLKEKKATGLLISEPDLLKRKLYEMYRNLDLPLQEKRRFLRMAIQLVEQLAENQTQAFLSGYQEIFQSFEASGLNKISLTKDEMHKIFFRHGYEMRASHKIDFIKTLERAKENHNELIAFLGRTFDLKTATKQDLGKEVFKSLLQSRYLDSPNFPYGRVELDLTPPITSIRLVCMDPRDYNFASSEIDQKTYQDKYNQKSQKTVSGGVSYGEKQQFNFSHGVIIKYFPLTVINGTSTSDYQKVVIKHEDAHQMIMYNEGGGNSKSAESRKNKHLADEFSFDSEFTSHEESNFILVLERDIKAQLNSAVSRMRDEVQAYLTVGTSIPDIKKTLSKDTPEALYDYVCDTKYRIQKIERIEKKFGTNEESKDLLIKTFKEGVLKARNLYSNTRERYISKVELLLDSFSIHDTDVVAKRKLALIVRHTTPEEFVEITKYLRRRKKYKAEKKELTYHEKRDNFLKQSVIEQVLSLNDNELELLMDKAEQELVEYISMMKKWVDLAPEHLKQYIPELITLSQSLPTYTKESVRLFFNIMKKLVVDKKGLLIWSKKEQEEMELFEERNAYFVSELRKVLIYGQTPIERIEQAIKEAYPPQQFPPDYFQKGGAKLSESKMKQLQWG